MEMYPCVIMIGFKQHVHSTESPANSWVSVQSWTKFLGACCSELPFWLVWKHVVSMLVGFIPHFFFTFPKKSSFLMGTSVFFLWVTPPFFRAFRDSAASGGPQCGNQTLTCTIQDLAGRESWPASRTPITDSYIGGTNKANYSGAS